MANKTVNVYRVTVYDKANLKVALSIDAHFTTAETEQKVREEVILANAALLSSIAPENLLITLSHRKGATWSIAE